MFVYVISAGERRHKVGIAKAPEKRLRELQTGACDKLELVYACEAENAREIEQAAHQLMAHYRLHGEWFDVTRAGAISMIGAAARNTAICDPVWDAFGGWTHSVGDVVECRFSGEPWIVGPVPEAGRTYTISCVYEQGGIDVVEVPNEDIALCPSMFWPAIGRLKAA